MFAELSVLFFILSSSALGQLPGKEDWASIFMRGPDPVWHLLFLGPLVTMDGTWMLKKNNHG